MLHKRLSSLHIHNQTLLFARAHVQYSDEDLSPNLEVSLAPPVHPWPQVAAEIGNLEQSRENMEGAEMKELQNSFNRLGAVAKQRISASITKALSAFHDPALSNAAAFAKQCD